MNPQLDTQSDNGEIGSLADSPLQAGSLDDCAAEAAKDTQEGYGDAADERAVAALTVKLRSTPAFRGRPDSAVAEKAETMYALLCQQVQAGADADQVSKIATLIGEPAAELQQRLR